MILQKSPVLIALTSFSVGATAFLSGDLFDSKALIKAGFFDERQLDMFIRQAVVGPLTPQTYQRCMIRRPAGTVGAGFDAKELLEAGIIEEIPPRQDGKIDVPEDCEVIGPYALWAVPHPNPKMKPLWQVATIEGVKIRENRFKERDKAIAFLEGLIADAAEKDDELQLRSESDGSDQPG